MLPATPFVGVQSREATHVAAAAAPRSHVRRAIGPACCRFKQDGPNGFRHQVWQRGLAMAVVQLRKQHLHTGLLQPASPTACTRSTRAMAQPGQGVPGINFKMMFSMMVVGLWHMGHSSVKRG